MASPQGISVHDVREQLRSLGHDNVPDSIIEAFLADMRTGKAIGKINSPPAAQEPRKSSSVPKSKSAVQNLPASVSLARRSRTGGRAQAPPPRNVRKQGRPEFDQVGNVIFDDDEPCEGWSSQEPAEDSYGDIFAKAVRQPVSYTAAVPSPASRQAPSREGTGIASPELHRERSHANGAEVAASNVGSQRLYASNQDADFAVIDAIQGSGTLIRRHRTSQSEQPGVSQGLTALTGPGVETTNTKPSPGGPQHRRHYEHGDEAGPARGWAASEPTGRVDERAGKGPTRLPEGYMRASEQSPAEAAPSRQREARERPHAFAAEAWPEWSPEAVPTQRARSREADAPAVNVQMPRWKMGGDAVNMQPSPRHAAGHGMAAMARDTLPRRPASDKADEPRGARVPSRERPRQPMSASAAHHASYDNVDGDDGEDDRDDASDTLSRVTSSRSLVRQPHAARRKKTDRVARYEALANTWKRDPFLRHQQTGKRAPVNFYRLFEREHAQHAMEHEQAIQRRRRSVQAAILEHNRYQVPTSKRRDSLRHNVRMWMLSIQQEQPLDP